MTGGGPINPVWKLSKQALEGSICLEATVQLEEVVEKRPGMSARGHRQAKAWPWIWGEPWLPLRHWASGSSVLKPQHWGGRE